MGAAATSKAAPQFGCFLDRDLVEDLVCRLNHLGGRSCASVVRQAFLQQMEGNLDNHPLLGSVLVDVAWDKIHSGFWKDVDIVWRDVYALGQLVSAAPFLKALENTKSGLAEEPDAGADHTSSVSKGEATALSPGTCLAAKTAGSKADSVRGALHFCRYFSSSTTSSTVSEVDKGVGSHTSEAKRRKVAASGEGVSARALPPGPLKMVPQRQFQDTVSTSCNESNKPGPVADPPVLGFECPEKVKLGNNQALEVLRQLDMGTLMGGPLFRDLLDHAIAAVQGCLVHPQNLYDEAALGITKQGSEQHRIPLPPGSLAKVPGSSVEVKHLPSLEGFLESYMAPMGASKPVMLTGCMDDWPALTKWQSLGYLMKVGGFRTVPVELGKDYLSDNWSQRLMTLSEFIQHHILHVPELDSQQQRKSTIDKCIEERKGYLAQYPLFDQIPALKSDICTPEYCILGQGQLQSVNAWFGPPGTVTPLHYDAHHNLLCQVIGKKYIRLYAPEMSACLAPYKDEMTKNSSQVDLDCPDKLQPQGFDDAPFLECVLRPGEMLYIPPRWWHYVKSLSVSFSVSFWWQ